MIKDWLNSALARASLLGKSHIWAIALALLIGALYAGPDIYHALTPQYQGVMMTESTDADFYLTNVHRSYELSGWLGNPFLYEYREIRNTFQYFLVELVLGKIGAVFHLPIDQLTIVMGFFFPAALVLLLYAFTLHLSGSKRTAFLVSGVMLLGNEIVHPDGLVNMINTFLFNGGAREFLTYSRPINPQASALFLYGTLYALFSLARDPRSRWAMAFSGIGVGLLMYIYIYFWAFAFTLLGIVFLYALSARNRSLILATAVAGVVSVLLMAPYAFANLMVLLNESGGGLTQTIHTHRMILEKAILAPLFLYVLIYLWGWWKRGKESSGQWAVEFSEKYLFVLLLLITGLIVSNQQVLTGRLLFVEHFHFYTNIPMFLLSMSILGAELLRLFPRMWQNLAIGTLLAVLAWFAVGVQVSSYQAHSSEALRYQSLAPIFSYLREHGLPQAVLLTNPYLSTRHTLYTQDFSYSAGGYDTTFQVPQERIVHNYFVILALRGVTMDNIRSYVYEPIHRNEIGYTIFTGTYWRDLCGSGGCFPDSVLEELISAYQEFLKEPLLARVKEYRADYLLWDSVADSKWKLEGLVSEEPILQSGDFKLYTLR